MKKKVVVGLSGGVDSSVSAYLLKEAGYEVLGLYMKNWEEVDEHGECSSKKDFEDTQKVCDQLKIPLYTVNFAEEYLDEVFQNFIDTLKMGLTPNPDILCNKQIKFHHLLKKAQSLSADYLATGHYCRTSSPSEGPVQLLKGLDPGKDQSYFLHAIDKCVLPSVLFPVGHLLKSEVRKIAKEANIPVADKKDSTGICFIGKRNFRSFVQGYIPYQTGKLCRLDGTVVGEHEGAAFYTIGQRKGLKIGGPGDAWFVVGKEIDRNIVFVEQGEDHPALFASQIIAKSAHWLSDILLPCKLSAKIRYRQADEACTVEQIDDQLLITFDRPQRAITPGQSVVFYLGDICLGGAIIEQALKKALDCDTRHPHHQDSLSTQSDQDSLSEPLHCIPQEF